MNKTKIRNFLDFIPLFILTILAFNLFWKYASNEIGLQWKHVVGFIFLLVNIVLFFRNHRMGVLFLGLMLVAGLFSILSFSPVISTSYLYKEIGGTEIPLFYGQPVFLLLLVLHFILSLRYYIGIGTKRYWDNFF